MSITLRDAFSVTRFSFWAGVMLSTLVGGVLFFGDRVNPAQIAFMAMIVVGVVGTKLFASA